MCRPCIITIRGLYAFDCVFFFLLFRILIAFSHLIVVPARLAVPFPFEGLSSRCKGLILIFRFSNSLCLAGDLFFMCIRAHRIKIRDLHYLDRNEMYCDFCFYPIVHPSFVFDL